MTFVTHRPPPGLRGLVGTAHGYRVPAIPTGVHRGLPSRHISLVLELDRPLRVSGPAGSIAAHGVVGGLHTLPVQIDASIPQEGLQYGLSPLGCEALLGVPAQALAGELVDLRDVFGRAADELAERAAASDWHERFQLLDDALLRRLDGTRPAGDPAMAEAWRVVFAEGGRLPVEHSTAASRSASR